MEHFCVAGKMTGSSGADIHSLKWRRIWDKITFKDSSYL